VDDFSTLFELLPIGAYRSLPDGTQTRANPALVKLNGYASEAEMLVRVKDIGTEWYVQAGRRDTFKRRLEQEGRVTGFVSEVYRHRSRERIWIRENAHVVRDDAGRILYYEGTVEDITEQRRSELALLASEAQLREIAEQMPAFVYRVRFEPDGQRSYLFVSEGVRAIYGLSPQEAMAQPLRLLQMRHPDDRQHDVERAAQLIREGQPLNSEFRVCPLGGGTRWVQVRSVEVARDGEARIRSGAMIDITEQKLAQQALQAQAALWQRVLDSVGDGVWDWNLVTGEERLSENCFQIYGYRSGDFRGRASELDALTHPDDVPQMQRDREAHFRGDVPVYVNEHRIRCADGRWKWVLSRGVVIESDESGRPMRMIGTHTDISERRQAEALLRERDAAAAADQAKTQLLSRVSHELRTPLNAVLGFGQLLQADAALGAAAQAQARHIVDAGWHLLRLVDDLLDLGAIESGQVKVRLQSVALHDAFAAAWNMLAASGSQASAVLQVGPELAGLPAVRADHGRLVQVFANLLSNALKYCGAGAEIRVCARTSDDRVELDVCDNGPGFSAEQMRRAFNPFERLGAEHTSVQGTGLGLTLARQFMLSMGGLITLQSEPGRGSTFTLSLPRVDPIQST
jgi:PAS domain S-box-containing protein